MGYFKRLKTSGSVSLEAFKMYYVMRASAPSLHRESASAPFLHRESTDSLIYISSSDESISCLLRDGRLVKMIATRHCHYCI